MARFKAKGVAGNPGRTRNFASPGMRLRSKGADEVLQSHHHKEVKYVEEDRPILGSIGSIGQIAYWFNGENLKLGFLFSHATG